MPTMTFINDDGDKILIEVPSEAAEAYKADGYHEATGEELGAAGISNVEHTRAAISAAAVLSSQEILEGSSPNARSQDPEDAPADPFGVAYPAGQIPHDAGAVGATNTMIPPLDEVHQAMIDDPNSPNPGEKDGSSQRANPEVKPNTGPEGTSYLIHSYETPPNKDEIDAAMKASKNDPSVPVDTRGVIDRTVVNDPAAPMTSDSPVEAKNAPESTDDSSGAAPVASSSSVETPADLTASNVVKETQGAKGGDGEKSQGTERPTASPSARSKK